MRWIAISGSWRNIDDTVERDVRKIVANLISEGVGIVCGGALGVDFIAVDEALRHDPKASQIKVILPTSFKTYITHFRKRAAEHVITECQANALINQIADLRARNRHSLSEMNFRECTPATYHARNSEIIKSADSLFAFQINKSEGVQDAIDKAMCRGIEVHLKSYEIVPRASSGY